MGLKMCCAVLENVTCSARHDPAGRAADHHHHGGERGGQDLGEERALISTFKWHVKSTKQSQSQLETKRDVKLSLTGRARLHNLHSELQCCRRDGRTAADPAWSLHGMLRCSPRSGRATKDFQLLRRDFFTILN